MSERLSRFLSYMLRHHPEEHDVALTPDGWANLDQVLTACATNGRHVTRDDIIMLIDTQTKARFILDEHRNRIRAAHGHSTTITLHSQGHHPPTTLWHGTTTNALNAIRQQGLLPMERVYVHLSEHRNVARDVAQRRGTPALLTIRAATMAADGHLFYRSESGVWLTDHVPPGYLDG